MISTPVKDLQPGDLLDKYARPKVVVNVEEVVPGLYAAYEYDDFRGSGRPYLQVNFTTTSDSGEPFLSGQSYPADATVGVFDDRD